MKRPFVTLCIFLFVGIVVSHLFNYFIPIYYVIFSILFVLISFLIYGKGFNVLFTLAIMVLGAYLYGQSMTGDKLLETSTHSSIIKAKILREAVPKRGYSEYEVKIVCIFIDEDSRGIKTSQRSQLNIYQSPAEDYIFAVGDIVEIRNANVRKVLGNCDGDTENGYELFLKSKGLGHILNVNIKDVKKTDTNFGCADMLGKSYKAKIYLEDFLDSTLDFENSNVLKSIIFGNQGYLSREKLDIFSRTGTAHIMAVSGLHVGLMVLVADRFLRLMDIGKNKRLYLVAAFLIFYGHMVYFPISIVRAGAMYLLYVAAYFLQKRYDSINALFFIGFILLICRPMIIFSVSFQLSFMATLSILLLYSILNRRLNKIMGLLSPLVSVTLAAQIGTFPIMAYHFNQISLISLITNLLIVPIISPMLSIVSVGVLVGTVSFRLGFLINRITNNLLDYINWITTKCAVIPYGNFEVKGIGSAYIFSYYIILGIVYFLLCKGDCLKEERPVRIYEL